MYNLSKITCISKYVCVLDIYETQGVDRNPKQQDIFTAYKNRIPDDIPRANEVIM